MKEFRFHGRGGQGTVLASIALAKAFFAAGYWVQTFPVFGSERRGAPVEAYLRLDIAKIYLRSNIYAPDHVIVQDAGLLAFLDVTRGLKPGGWILLNTPGLPADLKPFEGFCLACIDASAIARAHGLGAKTQPITNTAMMGAFSRLFTNPPLDAVLQAIAREVPVKIDENVAAARTAFDAVVLHGLVHGSDFLPMAAPLFRKAVS